MGHHWNFKSSISGITFCSAWFCNWPPALLVADILALLRLNVAGNTVCAMLQGFDILLRAETNFWHLYVLFHIQRASHSRVTLGLAFLRTSRVFCIVKSEMTYSPTRASGTHFDPVCRALLLHALSLFTIPCLELSSFQEIMKQLSKMDLADKRSTTNKLVLSQQLLVDQYTMWIVRGRSW